jgi:hypothetical protein
MHRVSRHDLACSSANVVMSLTTVCPLLFVLTSNLLDTAPPLLESPRVMPSVLTVPGTSYCLFCSGQRKCNERCVYRLHHTKLTHDFCYYFMIILWLRFNTGLQPAYSRLLLPLVHLPLVLECTPNSTPGPIILRRGLSTALSSTMFPSVLHRFLARTCIL